MGKLAGENRMVQRRDASRGHSQQYSSVRDHWFRKIDQFQLFITAESFRSHCTHVSSPFRCLRECLDIVLVVRPSLSHHCAVKPPSTSKLWPVTNDDLLDESQMAASAISSGLPMRPMGCMAVICAW